MFLFLFVLRAGHIPPGLFLLPARLPGAGPARVADEDDDQDAEQGDQNGDHTQHAHQRGAAGDPEAHQAADGGEGVEHQDRLLLAQPQGQEPVVEVALVRLEGALPVDNAADDGKGGIRQGDGKGDHGL